MTPEKTSNSTDATEPARYVSDEASVLGRNRRNLLATLAQAGGVTATATYVGAGGAGGGGDGAVEMPTEAPFDMAALVTVFAERGVFENGKWQTTVVEQQLSIEQALRDFTDEGIDVVQGGWENSDGGSVSVSFYCHAGPVPNAHTAYSTTPPTA